MPCEIPRDAYVIILGAQKSATTTLYNIICQHRSICIHTKEPKYFAKKTSKKYESLFEYDDEKHEKVLEASTAYTMYPAVTGVPKKMREYGIEPKFIYSVRNPFERIESEYEFGHVRNMDWAKENVLNLDAIHRSMYYLQVSEYLKYYPDKKRYLIVDFENIVSSSQKVADKIFEWIDIESYEVKEPEATNETLSSTEARLASIPIHWRKFIPSGVRNKIKEFLRRNESRRSSLTRREREKLRGWMRRDMRRFGEEFDFPIEKWGF
jgi:hypothetical protein